MAVCTSYFSISDFAGKNDMAAVLQTYMVAREYVEILDLDNLLSEIVVVFFSRMRCKSMSLFYKLPC